jgi:hypothetical protein
LAEEFAVMQLVFADKLQTIIMASESSQEYKDIMLLIREIQHIYAPAADRRQSSLPGQ